MKLSCATSRMPGTTSECAATLIASDSVSNFEKMDAAMLALTSIASHNAAKFGRMDAARSFNAVGLERRQTNEEDAYTSCCGNARAQRVWCTKRPEGKTLCAMPTVPGTPERVL